MSFTNGQLAQKIVDLISYWSGFNDQYHQWLTGTVNGGPNSDGRYPLTDWTGYTVNVQCPAQLEEEVLSLVNGAASSEAAAIAAAAAAAQSLQDAIAQVALATTARQDAETAQVAAELAQAGAEDAKVVAIAQANLAAASNAASIQSAADALASEVAAAASAAAAAQSAIDAANAIGIADAPADGQTYGRNNNAWSVVGGGGGGDVSYDGDGDIPVFIGTDREFALGDEVFESAGSGLYDWGGFTYTVGATTFDIGVVDGHIIDFPNKKYIKIDIPGGFTNVTPLVSSGTSYLYVDATGALIQSGAFPTEGDRRNKLLLGRVVAEGGAIIGAAEGPTVLLDPVNQIRDLAEALQSFSMFGNQITPSATPMKLAKTAGAAFLMGSNFHTDQLNPNERPIPSADPLVFKYAGRTVASASLIPTDLIDPTVWDDNGTLDTVNNKRTTIQRLFLFPATNQFGIQYGQEEFTSLAKATKAFERNEVTVVNNPIIAQNQGILLATIAITATATDLSDDRQCLIFAASRFGEATVGAGAVSVSELQDVYDNTVSSPVITLRDEGDAFLTIKDSPTTALKGLKVFEIENGVGTAVAYVDNTGLITTASNGTSAQWNTAFGWGDHATAGYLTSYTETDPVFSASVAAGITVGALNNWNTAFGWGDHATEGYLTSIPASYVENNVGETISGAWSYTAKVTLGATTGFQLGGMTVTEDNDSFAIDKQTRYTNASGFVGLSVVAGTGLALFDTDATEFIMGKGLQVNGAIRKYNGGSPLPVLTLTNTAYPTGGNVTISTSAPSGGVDGDFWVQYT